MNVGIIGTGAQAAARRRAVEALAGAHVVRVFDAGLNVTTPYDGPGVLAVTPFDAFLAEVDAVFVAASTAQHFRLAEATTKRGVHVFLEWPPATSIHECQAMVQLSEEAGVEVGVSRPLRFLPVFDRRPVAWRASLILLHQEVSDAEAAWPHWLADAVDLCCALARSHSIQRVDAEAVRGAAPWPDAVAFGLRFHSGAYAQVSIRRSGGAPSGRLYGGGAGFEVEADVPTPLAGKENDASSEAYETAPPLLVAETQAFLDAVAGQQPVPVSILDGLHTLRLVERLMQKLR